MENEKVIQTVAGEMPSEHAEKIMGLSSKEVWGVMEQFPTIANSFISTLTNKVTKSLIYSRIFENPLKMLKKEMLQYGDSIEQLYVEMAQVKGFTAHWHKESATPEADLIRKLTPEIDALYITINTDYKLKTTIMDKSLRKAFYQEGGLSTLISRIISSITSSAEYKEFNLMKAVYENVINEGKAIKSIDDEGNPIFTTVNNGLSNPIKQVPFAVKIEGANDNEKMKLLSEKIREHTGFMKFPSDKYNLAKKLVWCNPDELILITTPTTVAKLDVQVLSSAFNVSKADINTRTILVDKMPDGIFKLGEDNLITKDDTKKPIAILMSKDFLQIRDTYQGAGTFHNPEGQYTNHFANREGIFSVCLFENMMVFYE